MLIGAKAPILPQKKIRKTWANRRKETPQSNRWGRVAQGTREIKSWGGEEKSGTIRTVVNPSSIEGGSTTHNASHEEGTYYRKLKSHVGKAALTK